MQIRGESDANLILCESRSSVEFAWNVTREANKLAQAEQNLLKCVISRPRRYFHDSKLVDVMLLVCSPVY